MTFSVVSTIIGYKVTCVGVRHISRTEMISCQDCSTVPHRDQQIPKS